MTWLDNIDDMELMVEAPAVSVIMLNREIAVEDVSGELDSLLHYRGCLKKLFYHRGIEDTEFLGLARKLFF